MLVSTLKQIGLNEKQAQIYVACLELGETSIKEIAKKSGVKRTTIYDFIDDMVNSGFIKQTVKGKKKRYVATEPDELKIVIKKREALLSQILPQLNLINNVDRTKPKIWFYNGVEGLKEVYSDTLNYKGEILAISGEDVIKVVGLDWILSYVKKRVKKGIRVKGIAATTDFLKKEIMDKDKEHLRVSKSIDYKKYPFPIEINIYGGKRVFFVSALEQTAIIIEAPEIYKAMKSFFEMLWDHLPK
ncbi:MAG: helix-turn-helix domain-containing protein [Patescibacteria group bacterium]|jgi:sugar-specific transcriptional regulator TrmB